MKITKCPHFSVLDKYIFFHCSPICPSLVLGVELEFPSNTFYPPGLVCAKENTKWFCPTSGESGSPLMRKNDNNRFEAEGILSFIKVCDIKQNNIR